MARCANCGRKAGGFSLRAFNDISGRCDECDSTSKRNRWPHWISFAPRFNTSQEAEREPKVIGSHLRKVTAEEGLDFSEAISASFIE